MDKLIATIPKNAREEIRIDIAEFQGHDLLGIRIYVDGDERVATRKGITVKVGLLLPDLIAALQAAEREARAAGLLGDDEAAA